MVAAVVDAHVHMPRGRFVGGMHAHGDGALVVDVNVPIPDNQQEGSIELQTTELTLEYNKNKLTGEKAEAFCISKGGHLASASTPIGQFRIIGSGSFITTIFRTQA